MAQPASATAAGVKSYISDSAQLSFAEFLMKDGDFARAAREFERVDEVFPSSPLVERAYFMAASAYLEGGYYKEARVGFSRFLDNYATGAFGVEAAEGLKRAKRLFKSEAAAKRGVARSSGGSAESVPATLPSGLKTVKLVPYRAPRDGRAARIRPLDNGRKGVLRAVQVMLFNSASKREIQRELDTLKAAGIDTVIVRVFHNPGDRYYRGVNSKSRSGVYFRTTHAPVVADLLGSILDAAHASGLRVFAWMTTRYADYGLEDRAELACRGYDLTARRLVRCKGLDVFNEKAVEHIEALYSDLASYDIDGILFQDDLILKHNEGFGTHAAALYARVYGQSLIAEDLYIRDSGDGHVRYTASFWHWASWKNKRLLYVAERLKSVVREKRPEAEFAINLMYETVTNPPDALAWFSQDLAAAVRSGFDYYSIMAYHRQMGKELGKDVEDIRAMIEEMVEYATAVVGEPHRVLIKLQTIDWKTRRPVADSEVARFISTVVDSGGVSLAVVPYRSDFPFHILGAAGGF